MFLVEKAIQVWRWAWHENN